MMPFAAMRMRQQAGGGGGSFGKFNPADKSANITLSGSDMIATSTNGGDLYMGFGMPSKAISATVKCVEFEILVNDACVGFARAGAANPASNPNSGFYSIYYSGGATFSGGGTDGGKPTFAPGDIIGCTAAQSGATWQHRFYKNGTLAATTTMASGDLRFCFSGYYDNNASVEVITDPSLMTYFGSYGAAEGWTA